MSSGPVRNKHGLWTNTEILDPDTGEVHVQWFYKGRRCARVPIDGRIARQLAGYQLIEKDLRSVQVWLKELHRLTAPEAGTPGSRVGRIREKDRSDMAKGLFVASLTFYGKCFTSCEGRSIQLNRAQLSAPFQKTHENVMAYRHQFAAHSGADKFEEVFVGLAIPQQKKHYEESILIMELKQPSAALIHDDDAEHSFPGLAKHVHEVVLRRREELKSLVMEREVRPEGIDYWLARARRSR